MDFGFEMKWHLEIFFSALVLRMDGSVVFLATKVDPDAQCQIREFEI
jgi:hypothetical protein